MKKKVLISVMIISLGGIWLLGGCESSGQTGALVGAGAGAGIGQAVGHDTKSTLIGSAIGGLGGYIIGNEKDKKEAAAETDAKTEQVRQEMNITTVNITCSNGSIIQVKLTKDGVGYRGPRGEYYPTLPTEDQLRPVYGF